MFELNKIRKLEGVLKRVHQFSYTVSHDLRSPVASVLGLINVMQHEIDRAANRREEQKRLLKLIEETIKLLDCHLHGLMKVLQTSEQEDFATAAAAAINEVYFQDVFDEAMHLLEPLRENSNPTLITNRFF